ncbi:uncharacterized protein [Fopius arisanus]|uniref:Uncharacterized protein n=1 Tax=Fopius arisanus TaxID=64838 RepID=A0A9R1UA86_9HYME|nr:PREDICTED: uncharacterized protein LOC105272505 [Fopius arisanus]
MDFSPGGTKLLRRGRPLKNKTNNFNAKLLSEKSLSDDENEFHVDGDDGDEIEGALMRSAEGATEDSTEVGETPERGKKPRNELSQERDGDVREIREKRHERLAQIYAISEGKTEDELEIERKPQKIRKTIDDKEYNLLPPARGRGHEIEIYPSTGIFLKKRWVRRAILRSGNKPRDLICELLRCLLGNRLENMTIYGGKDKDPIPKEVYHSGRWAVNSWVQRDYRLDEVEYRRCVTQLCTRSRSNYKKQPQNNGNVIEHRGEERRPMDHPIDVIPETIEELEATQPEYQKMKQVQKQQPVGFLNRRI